MTTDVLIRDIQPDVFQWLKESTPPGVSRNEFLKALISQARQSGPQVDLFTDGRPPVTVYGNMPFKFIDLFAGIGGFRSALTSIGGKCVFTNEWDGFAAKTYMAWYGEDEISTDDIRKQEVQKSIPDHDILCAGFPCQPFSIAGVSKKNSLGRAHGFEDKHQGNLFTEAILKIVDRKRPPILFLENVKNLRSHDKGNTWAVIESLLSEREYAVFAEVLNAKHWVPQHRERIFIVCFDTNVFGSKDQIDFQFPQIPSNTNHKLGDILSKEPPDRKYMLSEKLWKYLQGYKVKHAAKGNGFGFGLFNKNHEYTRTISARYYKDGSEILIEQKGWERPRRLTPDEARLLMGFDNRFAKLFAHENGFPQVVSDTQAYKQFGNSVCPKVVEAVAKEIIKTISKSILANGNGCLIKGSSKLAA